MYRRVFKKIFDFIFAIMLLPLFVIITIIIGPLIYFQDKGPIFYTAPRLGKNGKIFKVYKYRSMIVNAPDIRNEDGSTFNDEDDPRLTKIGKLIRKTSIDEIPQILNVIKGEMSVIGPRPSIPGKKIDEYDNKRLKKIAVDPGITGYTQAYFRNSISQEEKCEHDAYYADNISLLFDIKIFMKTIFSVINRKNIYNSKQY